MTQMGDKNNDIDNDIMWRAFRICLLHGVNDEHMGFKLNRSWLVIWEGSISIENSLTLDEATMAVKEPQCHRLSGSRAPKVVEK